MPKRRTHLATLVVMAVVMSSLIWSNIAPIVISIAPVVEQGTDPKPQRYLYLYGWPRVAWEIQYKVRSDGTGEYSKMSSDDAGYLHYLESPKQGQWIFGMIENAFVALVILFAVWFLCEWLIRRGVARKT